MSLQQRYQRLGRDDSWRASFRDIVLLVIGLPLALAGAGMLVTSKEAGEAQVQAVRAVKPAPTLYPSTQALLDRAHSTRGAATPSPTVEADHQAPPSEDPSVPAPTKRARRLEW